MPALIVDNLLVEVPNRYSEGITLSKNDAAVFFTEIFLPRIIARAQYHIRRNPDIEPLALCAWVEALAASYQFTSEPEPDVLENEAIAIASDILRAKLMAEGLPIPSGFDDHVMVLAESEAVRAKARTLIETRNSVHNASMQNLREGT